MSFESNADKFLAILQDTREQLAYLHELGVENLETGQDARITSARAQQRSGPHLSVTAGDGLPASRSENLPVTVADPTSVGVPPPIATLFGDISASPVKLEKSSETLEEIWSDI
jgi:hypothetical protein